MDGDLLRELRGADPRPLPQRAQIAPGWSSGSRQQAQRLANLVEKGRVFRRAIMLPVRRRGRSSTVPGQVKLSSLNVRSADPYGDCGQPWHADSGAIADDRGYWVCNPFGCSTTSPSRMAPPGWSRAHTGGARVPPPVCDTLRRTDEILTGTPEAWW